MADRIRTRKRTVFRIEIHEIATESKMLLTQDKDTIDLPAILKAVNGMA